MRTRPFGGLCCQCGKTKWKKTTRISVRTKLAEKTSPITLPTLSGWPISFPNTAFGFPSV